MILGKAQPFASPEEALAHISEDPWSNYTKADYTVEQWHAACLIHLHDGAPTSKSECKLPVKTPNGTLNRNGVHAAAAALAGARGGLKGVSADQKQKAANALKRYYAQLDEEAPTSLAQHTTIDFRVKPGSPSDILEHHGVKGMRWGVRKDEETSSSPQGSALRGTFRSRRTLEKYTGSRTFTPKTETKFALLGPAALADRSVRSEIKEADRLIREGKASGLKPGTPEFQQRIERITRTDNPQVLGAQRAKEKHGLTKEQKIFLAVGAAGMAAAGYYAYSRYTGNKLPGADLNKLRQEEQKIESALGQHKIPAHWDVRGLKDGPISAQRLGDLAGGEVNAKLKDAENLVINTSRGYADILPKDGFSNPFAAEQHASVTRVLEEMRDKYPSIRNMNVEVVPMSKVPGLENSTANMCVMSMRAGEARVMYNDLMDAPTDAIIRANRRFLPGLGKKDYVAYHEMGHLLAAAHGDLPASFDLLRDNASPTSWRTWQRVEPLLHKRTFARHGFTFQELSKISQYAATQPAEAMAELFGHYSHPEMRQRLTPDQLVRAEAMFNEMGGLT